MSEVREFNSTSPIDIQEAKGRFRKRTAILSLHGSSEVAIKGYDGKDRLLIATSSTKKFNSGFVGTKFIVDLTDGPKLIENGAVITDFAKAPHGKLSFYFGMDFCRRFSSTDDENFRAIELAKYMGCSNLIVYGLQDELLDDRIYQKYILSCIGFDSVVFRTFKDVEVDKVIGADATLIVMYGSNGACAEAALMLLSQQTVLPKQLLSVSGNGSESLISVVRDSVYDHVLFIRTGDFYSPGYIDKVISYLEGYDLVGFGYSAIYDLNRRLYKFCDKVDRSLLQSCGFKKSVRLLDNVQGWDTTPGIWEDGVLLSPGPKYATETGIGLDYVTITGIGNFPDEFVEESYRKDDDLNVFKEWLGDSSDEFHKILRKGNFLWG